MANVLLVERVVGQRIDIGVLHAYIHYLMSKAKGQVTTHAEVTRLGSIAQRQLIGSNQLRNLIGILLTEYIRHTLVVAHGCTRVELEHLLAERRVAHKVRTDIPRNHIRIDGLHIAFARLVINGVVGERILRERSTEASHDTRELLLIEL